MATPPPAPLLAPKVLLHLEGLAIGIAAVLAYRALGASWTEFGLLCLAPDLAMIGFALGPAPGTAIYNLVHTYALVAVVGLLGWAGHVAGLPAICLIWIAHIGFDRALGFGLKYPRAFKDTHLQRV